MEERSAVNFLYASSYEREAAARLFAVAQTHPMPQALFYDIVRYYRGVMDVTLRRDGKLPSGFWRLRPSAIAAAGFSAMRAVRRWRSVIVMSRNACWKTVLASLDEPRKPKPGNAYSAETISSRHSEP